MSRQIPLVVALLTMLVNGCASPTEQYASFAQAGKVYTSALDRLLLVEGNIHIDVNSVRLLDDDEIVNQNRQAYEESTKRDKRHLEIIGNLRTHARLLARYFKSMNKLATSDEPERAQQAIAGTVDELNSIGRSLRGSELIPNQDVFQSLTHLAVSGAIHGLLRDELEKRKDTIRLELKTQEELLNALASNIRNDFQIIYQYLEEALVIGPLISTTPVEDPKEWIANRRMILTAGAQIEGLEDASKAASKLREAFEELVEGKLTPRHANALLKEQESFLALVEAISH